MNQVAMPFALRAAIALTVVWGAQVNAASFRVTTRIFQGASLDAVAEHQILFDEGLAYDLPQIESRFVTVYDPAQKRVTLLDRQTQQQTTISVEDLVKVTAQVRASAATQDQQEKLGLMARVQPSNRVIGYSVQFANFEYHTAPQSPEDSSIATDYGRFADLASRLNLVRRLGPPPFARMRLNEHLAARGEMPLETMRMHQHGESRTEHRSTHTLEELSLGDRQKIDEVRGMLQLYPQVGFNDFPR